MRRLASVFVVAIFGTGCSADFPHETSRATWGANVFAEPHESASMLNDRLTLAPSASGEVVHYDTAVLSSTLGIEQVVLSWNVDVPKRMGVWFEVRVRADFNAVWSPWLFMGEWGEGNPDPSPRIATTNGLKVEVDVLTSRTWFRDVQVRVSAMRDAGGEARAAVVVHRLDVTRSLAFSKFAGGFRANANRIPEWKKWGLPSSFAHEVSFFSQATSDPGLAGLLCSPTSVTMAIHWAKPDAAATVAAVASLVRDPRHGIYGNWPRNVEGAFVNGVPGKVVRFGSLKNVYEVLSRGGLIVASIKVAKGELPGAPYSETDGHLIVVRGYDERGDLLVSDPATKDAEKGETTYSREAMAKVWLMNGRGTGYVFWKPGMGDPSVP